MAAPHLVPVWYAMLECGMAAFAGGVIGAWILNWREQRRKRK
jgi:hypothetical protein